MANIEIDNLKYLDVQILKTEINNIVKNPLQRGDDFQLEYQIKATHLYNIEKHLVRVIIDANIIVMNDKKKVDAGAKFEIDNYFEYKGLENFAHKDGDKILIQSEFAETVKTLAYSTARGVIHSKLAGTFLEGTILPVKMSTDV